MAFKPLIVNQGQLQSLPAGSALDVGGWTLPVSGGAQGSVLVADMSGNAVWSAPPSNFPLPTADNQLLQATGPGASAWTTDIQTLTSLVVDSLTLDGDAITGSANLVRIPSKTQVGYTPSHTATSLSINNNINEASYVFAVTVEGTYKSSTHDVYGLWCSATLAPPNAKSAYGEGFTWRIDTGTSNTVNYAYAIYISPLAKLGTGTVANAIGLYVPKQTIGTTNYSILVAGGDCLLQEDNAKWWFGAGKDDAIYHNGTNLVLDPANALYVDSKIIHNGPLYRSSGAANHWQTLYQISDGQGSRQGTLKLRLPVGWNDSMHSMKILGYDYRSGNGPWELLVGGYNYSAGAWYQHGADIRGFAPFTKVRLAHDGTGVCILLGDESTFWSYTTFCVTDLVCRYDRPFDGVWNISFSQNEAADWTLSATVNCRVKCLPAVSNGLPPGAGYLLQSTGAGTAAWTLDPRGTSTMSIGSSTKDAYATLDVVSPYAEGKYASQIHLHSSNTYGMYAGSHNAEIGYMLQGGHIWSGLLVMPRTADVAGIEFNDGNIYFLVDKGKTPGTPYTPTRVVTVSTTGMDITGDLTVNGISVTKNIQIGGSDVCKVLGENRTFYVRTTGSDANDGTTIVTAFLTPKRAIDELYRWVADGYNITIDFGEGVFSVPAALVPSYAYGANVTFTGVAYDYTAVPITAVGAVTASGTAGLDYQDISVTLPSGHPAVNGDFLIVKTASGGTNPDYVRGCHEVTAVSGTTVTIRVFRRAGTAPVPNASVVIDTCTLVRTVLYFPSGNGIKLRGAYHAGAWNKLILKGSLAYNGVWVLNGASIEAGSSFGTSHWAINIYAQSNGLFFGDSTHHSCSSGDIARCQNGGVVNIRYGANLTGAAAYGVRAFLGANAALAQSYIVGCGNGYAVWVFQSAYVDLTNATLRPGTGSYGVGVLKGGGVDVSSATSSYTNLHEVSGTGFVN